MKHPLDCVLVNGPLDESNKCCMLVCPPHPYCEYGSVGNRITDFLHGLLPSGSEEHEVLPFGSIQRGMLLLVGQLIWKWPSRDGLLILAPKIIQSDRYVLGNMAT